MARKGRRAIATPMIAKESMQLLALDGQGRLMSRMDGSADWRDIVSELLRLDSQWLVIEQWRSDDPVPAPRGEDIRIARALSRRLRPLEMKLADHVIEGDGARFSFREAGLL